VIEAQKEAFGDGGGHQGPYFISWNARRWKPTGRQPVVKVLRGKGSWGVKPDHYKQTGIVREKGVAILEYGTQKYPPVGIRDFVRKVKSGGNRL
jgi:hypothetical protein